MQNNRNFFITIALSVLILTLWQVFYMNPRIEAAARGRPHRGASAWRQSRRRSPPPPALVPRRCPRHAARLGSRLFQAPRRTPDATQALTGTGRIAIDTPSLSGSINLTGARLDDLRLKHYRLTVDKNSPDDRTAQPAVPAQRLLCRARLCRQRGDRRRSPGPDTVWTAESRRDADAVDPGHADLHQRQGPDLQAHDQRRHRLHVHRVRHGEQCRHRARLAVELWPRDALRQADPCQHLRAARGPDRRDRRGRSAGDQIRRRSKRTSRSFPASRPTAGSASPTSTGPWRWCRRTSSPSSRASASSRTVATATRPTS